MLRPRRRLPSLDMLCPYCAACPSAGPCAEAQHGKHFTSYVHVGDDDWNELFWLDALTTGLRTMYAQRAAEAETIRGWLVMSP